MTVSTEVMDAHSHGATASSRLPSPRALPSIRRASSLCSALAFAVAMGAGPAAAACERTHVVRPGESLSLIARQHYGTLGAYPTLHRENFAIIGRNPDIIHAGMILTIPCLDERPPRVQRSTSAPDNGFARRSPASIQFSVERGVSGVVPVASDAVMRTETLANRLVDGARPQIIDLAPRETLARGAIDGALSIGIDDWEALAQQQAAGLDRLASAAGIALDAPIVLVPADRSFRGLDAAARVYWLLKSAGAEDVAVLEGARGGWSDVGLPLSATVRVPVGLFGVSGTSPTAASPFGAAVPGATVVEASVQAPDATDDEGMVTEPLTQLAIQTLGNFKSLDIPLGLAPVQITDNGEGVAALAWFLLSEVAQIADVHFAERSAALTSGEAADGLRIVGRAVVGSDTAGAGAPSAADPGGENRSNPHDLAVTRPSRQDMSMEFGADAGATDTPALNVDRTSDGAEPTSPPSVQILNITPLQPPKDSARIPPGLQR